MNDWTGGYVADIGYTYGYYSELNPLRIKQLFTHAGLKFPKINTACELGFGQGLSINAHAAASQIEWYGTDFNPSQVVFAKELGEASGAGVRLYDDSFNDFAVRTDLPEFDFIGVHGIWSWINDENRTIIVDFIKRKLKVGGVLYISYNTLPGWSPFLPVRHLWTEHAKTLGAEGHGIVNRINGALDFSERLLAVNPIYSKINPQIAERVKKVKAQNRHYLAHEYFNRDWHPIHFATMMEWLAPAKLNFACSVNPIDHIDIINLTEAQQNLLKEIPDAMFRESVRDFIVNQQFRRDYWVKGSCSISKLEQIERNRELRIVLTVHRSEAEMKVTGALGQATLSEAVYGPILDVLADYKIKTVGQLEQTLQGREITLAQIVQAVMILTGSGQLSLVQEDSEISRAKKQTDKLNQFLLKKSASSGDIACLASPVTGGGVAIGRFQQLFLLAISKGKKNADECAQFAWQILAGQGQKIIKQGKTLETDHDNIQELKEQAEKFLEKQLPILRVLQIV